MVFNLDSPRKEDTCQSRYRQWVIPDHFSWWEPAWEFGQFSPQFWEPPNMDINLIIWTTTQSCKFQWKIKSVKTDWELSDRRKPVKSTGPNKPSSIQVRQRSQLGHTCLVWAESILHISFSQRLLQVIFCESLTVF